MKAILKKSILWWFPLPVIGILNGMLRGFLLNRIFPDFVAHQFSSLLMIIWIWLYLEAMYQKLGIQRSSNAWSIGLTWLVLTITFESLLGYFVFGLTLQSMLSEYNILEGRFWMLVLISILTGPMLYYKLGEHEQWAVRGRN